MFVPIWLVVLLLVLVLVGGNSFVNAARRKGFEKGKESQRQKSSYYISVIVGALQMLSAGEVRYGDYTLLQRLWRNFAESGLKPESFGWTMKQIEALQKANEQLQQNRENFTDTVARGRGGPKLRVDAEPPGLRKGLEH